MQVLFEKGGYKVLAHNGLKHPTTIVGFQNRNPLLEHKATIDDPVPFMPDSITKSSIKANFVSFMVNRNDWYLDDLALATSDVIRTHYAGTRIITYGSSMGAFAALNLAGVLDASYIIAISPVSTIFPPFARDIYDRRYEMDAMDLSSANDVIGSGALLEKAGVIFFDPHHQLDAAHAARLASLTSCSLVGLPYAGHPCGPVLNRIYILQRILTECAAGALDIPHMRKILISKMSAILGAEPAKTESLPEFLKKCRIDIARINPASMRNAIMEVSDPRVLGHQGPEMRQHLRELATWAVHSHLNWGDFPEFKDSTLFELCMGLCRYGEVRFAEEMVVPHLSRPKALNFAGVAAAYTKKA